MSLAGDIKMPRFLSRPVSKYITRSGARWQPEDVALCMALTLRHHGTVEAVRATARRLADLVCMEQQPKMKQLARYVESEKVIPCALAIINRVCSLVKIAPEVEFELSEPPRCHMKAMRLAGEPGGRFWQCQHCTHTKPVEVTHG